MREDLKLGILNVYHMDDKGISICSFLEVAAVPESDNGVGYSIYISFTFNFENVLK